MSAQGVAGVEPQTPPAAQRPVECPAAPRKRRLPAPSSPRRHAEGGFRKLDFSSIPVAPPEPLNTNSPRSASSPPPTPTPPARNLPLSTALHSPNSASVALAGHPEPEALPPPSATPSRSRQLRGFR
eukprot:tig00000980_g6136.t1